MDPFTNSPQLISYQSLAIQRIPSIVSPAYRANLIETIKDLLDKPDAGDSTLRWNIQAAYHSGVEPPSHEVLALALCSESGELEGSVFDFQKCFYRTRPDLAHHQSEWTVRGVIDRHNAKVRSGDIVGPIVTYTGATEVLQDNEPSDEDTSDDDDATRGEKRKAADTDEDKGKGKSVKRLANQHVDDIQTPRINELARRCSQERANIQKQREQNQRARQQGEREQTPNPIRKPTVFPRISIPAPIRFSPLAPSPLRASATVATTGPSKDDDGGDVAAAIAAKAAAAKAAATRQKADKLLAQAVDKLDHSAALQQELATLQTEKDVADVDSRRGLPNFLRESHNLTRRILTCQGDALRALVEAVRLQAPGDTGGSMRAAETKAETVLKGLGVLMKQVKDGSREEVQDSGGD